MCRNKLGEDSPILKFIRPKIQDGVESLMTLEEDKFKVLSDGRITSFFKEPIEFLMSVTA